MRKDYNGKDKTIPIGNREITNSKREFSQTVGYKISI